MLLSMMIQSLRGTKPEEYVVDFSNAEDLNLPDLLAKRNIKVVDRIPRSHHPEDTVIFVSGIKRFYVMKSKNWIQFDDQPE